MRRTAVLFAVALTAMISGSAMAEQKTFVLVVGNNASPPEDPTLAPLRYADDDAYRYYQLFKYGAEVVHLLTVADDETQRRHPEIGTIARPPSHDELRAAVQDLETRVDAENRLGNETLVYIAFSGHGSNDANGEPYLALLGESLRQQQLFSEVLDRVRASRVHLIIDACNAGAVVGVRGPFGADGGGELDATSEPVSNLESEAVLAKTSLAAYPHVGAIVATSAGQESHEWSRVEAGVFTHELVSGALGPADINGDRRIEYSEIQAFIASANRAVSDPRAKPNVRAIPPAVDQRAALVDWSRPGVRFLRGQTGAWGRFHIELQNGLRYLDAHLAPNTPLGIVIPPGAIAYLRTSEREAIIAGGTEPMSASDLEFAPLTVARRGSLDESLRRALFNQPYTRAYYRGYVDSRALVGVASDMTVDMTPDIVDDGSSTQTVGLVVAGSGLAALLTAGVATFVALDARSSFNATDIQADAMRLADREKMFRITAIALGAIGAVAVGTGTTLYFVGDTGDLGTASEGTSVEAGIIGRW